MKENIILKWSLILSIVIVANLFFNYSLSLTLNSPDQEVFCPSEKTSQNITTQQSCEQADGIWNSAPTPGEGIKNAGFCDLYSKCNEAYQDLSLIHI